MYHYKLSDISNHLWPIYSHPNLQNSRNESPSLIKTHITATIEWGCLILIGGCDIPLHHISDPIQSQFPWSTAITMDGGKPSFNHGCSKLARWPHAILGCTATSHGGLPDPQVCHCSLRLAMTSLKSHTSAIREIRSLISLMTKNFWIGETPKINTYHYQVTPGFWGDVRCCLTLKNWAIG